MTNPTKPRRRGYLDVAVHTWTCVTPECNFAYGASAPFVQFPIADLRNLDNPTLLKLVSSPTQGFHDWNRDNAGVMWGEGGRRVTPRGLTPHRTRDRACNRLIGFSRSGEAFEFAVNRLNDAELAGATFSPDGETLFVNIFGSSTGSTRPYTGKEGMTIAITGPWHRGPL